MTVTSPGAPETLRSRFQAGIGYNTLGAVFGQGSTFAVNIIVANLLGRDVFGQYAMVQSTLQALAIIAQFGSGYTAMKYVAEFRSIDPQRAGRIVGVLSSFAVLAATLAALTLLLASRWLATSVLKAPEIGGALGIGSVVLLFAVLNGFLMGALVGLESYRTLARVLVWGGVSYLVICASLAWLGGLNGAVAGLALSGGLQFVFFLVAVRTECARQGIAIRLRSDAGERSILFRFTLPAGLSGITLMLAPWLAAAFLVRRPDGYAQMAIYSASFNLLQVVLFLPNISTNVGMSVINHSASNPAKYRQTFWINLGITLVIVLGAVGAAALVGPTLLRLFGRDFAEGQVVLVILLIAAIPQGIAMALYQVIPSQSRMWLSFGAVALPRDALIVGLAYWLVATGGAQGLATAYAIAWTSALIVITGIVWRLGLRMPGPVTPPPQAGA